MLRFKRTSTISAALGQTSHENVEGGPSSRIGGPAAQASSRTRGGEPGPPPPGSINATPSADGSPPRTLSVRRWGRSGCVTFKPMADQARPVASAASSLAASAPARMIQPRSLSRRDDSIKASGGTAQAKTPGLGRR